jgi:hypothetical protein
MKEIQLPQANIRLGLSHNNNLYLLNPYFYVQIANYYCESRLEGSLYHDFFKETQNV